MFSALDVSTSALVAQRHRMDTISNNLANISTTRNEKGDLAPYQARFVVFQTDEGVGGHGAMGVRVSSVEIDQAEPKWRYEPGNPDRQKAGPHKDQVAYPNIDMMHQFTDAMEAARAYEANLGAMEITKDMEHQTLRILA